jgi:hypothetical protein
LLVDINNKNILLHVTRIHVFERVVPWIRDSQLTIDGGRIGIWSHRGAPLDTLETPVIALGGGQDRPQRIAKRIEWHNVGSGDSRHDKSCEEEKRGNSYW